MVTEKMIEAACKAVIEKRGYVWPDGFSDEEKSVGRENMRAALEAALCDYQERVHYAEGVADLAMKHRDEAEAALSTDAEPVAWMITETKPSGSKCWKVVEHEHQAREEAKSWSKLLDSVTVRPLYSAPPAPSVAVKDIAPADIYKILKPWADTDAIDRDYVTAISRKVAAALSAQTQILEVPEGWMIVPKKATREMCKDGERWTPMPEQVWEDMIGAAPISDLEAAPAAKLEVELSWRDSNIFDDAEGRN